jgi:hypothetical protein
MASSDCTFPAGLSKSPPPPTSDTRISEQDHAKMGLNRAVLEGQLERADAQLAACEKALTAAGVGKDDLRSTPAWRKSEAHRRQIRRRLRTSDAWHSRGAAAAEAGGEE